MSALNVELFYAFLFDMDDYISSGLSLALVLSPLPIVVDDARTVRLFRPDIQYRIEQE
jgi:hypothetical protein